MMTSSSRIGNRIVSIVLAAGAVLFAVVAFRAAGVGIPVHDPWLFPMLVVLPALMSVALAASLLGSPGLRANIVLLGVSLVAGLYVLETALAWAPQPGDPPPADQTGLDGRPFDTRSRLKVVADMRAEGTDALPAIGARSLRSSPPLGPGITLMGRPIAPFAHVSNRLIVDCNESGQFAMFNSDERGYNNPYGSWQQPIEVAAVGDSYIQGACVGPEENLVAGLRRGVAGTVGLGMADTGPLVMLGMIKEYLSDVRPREVFWFYYEGNDLRNLRAELASQELRQYLQARGTQDLLANQADIERVVASFLVDLVERTPEIVPPQRDDPSTAAIVRRWIRLTGVRTALGLADVSSRLQQCCDLEIFTSVLEEADRTVRGWGGRLHFVYLPAAGRYVHPLSALLDDDLRQRRVVLRAARRVGLPIVDVHAAFRATGTPKDLIYNARSHFNPAGYGVAAQAVLRHLGENRR